MLISVVTAVWNRVETIGQAMASVQSQDYPCVEHVVQDGGSTDGTLEAIKARANAGTRVISEPDKGLYDAINRGIACAQGDIIGLLHSDDYLAAPDILSRVAEAFADPAVDAVYGDLDYIAASGPPRVVRRWRSTAFRPALLARGWMPAHPTLYLRRRVIEAHGLYDTSFRISADYDAVLRYFSQPGFCAAYIPHVLVKMRVGGVSNASASGLVLKSREDLRALRRNGFGGSGRALTTLACKNFGKLKQFTGRDTERRTTDQGLAATPAQTQGAPGATAPGRRPSRETV